MIAYGWEQIKVFHLYHDSMFATSIILWIPATPAATKMDTVIKKENSSKKMRKTDLKAAETLIANTGNDKKKKTRGTNQGER